MTTKLLMAAVKQPSFFLLQCQHLPRRSCAEDTSLVNMVHQVANVIVTMNGSRPTKPFAPRSLLHHPGHHLSQLSRV